MESRKGLFSHTIFRDIARMDEEQLSKYMRIAFIGKQDVKFLPEPFWDYWFDMGKHGGPGMDGRTPPSPAYFLSNVHNMIAGTKAGVFTVGNKGDEQPNFAFRETYRAVLAGLLDECQTITGEPTDEQKRLASYTVEAVGKIQTSEEFGRYFEEMVHQSRGGKESAPIAHNYPAELSEDLTASDEQHTRMIESSQQLIDSGRFGPLQLHYNAY